MFKIILLKIAHAINKHYQIIEIQQGDFIKYQGITFCICSTQLNSEYMGRNALQIEAQDGTTYFNK